MFETRASGARRGRFGRHERVVDSVAALSITGLSFDVSISLLVVVGCWKWGLGRWASRNSG
jgi:hypothetical protein